MPYNTRQYSAIHDVINDLKPGEPVYCIYPRLLHSDVKQFIKGFPGRVMYALKANPDPRIVEQVLAAGIRDVDAASIEEMELVHAIDPTVRCYFMAPVRLRGAVERAYTAHNVRDYVVDHRDELLRVAAELPQQDVTVFVRMATNNPDATYNLSEKFGASHSDTVALLREVASLGFEPALAFNTGSLVRRPDAYVDALKHCQHILAEANVAVRQVDVGGGFPSDYPGMRSEPWQSFFDAIDTTRQSLPLLRDVELHAEPGRALIANGMSLLTQVLHRAGDRLFINDGVWGSMVEPMLSKGELRYPSRAFRGTTPLVGADQDFEVFGPTCDSLDRLPAPLPLPRDLAAGDWIEFGTMGAYSLSNRTHFNGFFPDNFIEIVGDNSAPPAAG